MELTVRNMRWIAAAGLIAVMTSACDTRERDPDYPLPFKRQDASVLRRIQLADPSTKNTTVAADDHTITMEVSWSGCDYKPDLVARETTKQVTLLLRRRDASGPDIGCEDGGIAKLTVVLHQPLSTRALADTLTGEPVPHTHT
ncbi:hypothetical protein [Kitasatospora sp. NPDC087314]|uniref:hypothetical protein n=1 Tax=Kitasatospora sp. NPDC087314 TaxID=3364068 RepID=UPI003830E0D6